MQENQLISFLECRPFEPFVVTMVGGREITIPHNEFVTPSRGGLGLWIIHDSGHVEAIDSALILSARTVHPVDASKLMG